VSDTLDERLENRAAAIVDLLAVKPERDSPLRDAEFRKNLGRLYMAIRETQRLSRARSLGQREAQLKQLLLARDDFMDLNADALGLMLETIDEELVEAGDERLLDALLATEYVRDADERGGPVPTWSTIHGGARPTDLDEQKRMLLTLLRARHSIYALRRAREGARADRLVLLAPALAALVVAFVALTAAISDASWRVGLLAAVAGATGATVAAAFKLRDALARLSALRTFPSAFALQTALGAAAGVFLWTVLESRFVDIGGEGEDWAAAVALAFVGGFSEPLLLKTIERIAGGGTDDDKAK
jgi:hypothetical protein